MKDEQFEKYQDLRNKKEHIRDTIDGCLNRISITDDEDERFKMVYFLNKYILDYIELSKQSNNLYYQMIGDKQ